LREIIKQNTLKNKEEIEDLKSANATVKEYIQALPNIKRFFITLAGIIFGIITIMQVLGIHNIIFQIIEAEYDLFLILAIAIPLVIGIVSVEIFTSAFRIKRQKFLNTDLSYPCHDLYFGRGKEIYEKSVYKIEDELYEKLGKKNQKPKELPVDIILQYIIPGSMIGFFSVLFIIGLIASFFSDAIEVPIEIWYASPLVFFFIYGAFGIPFLKHRRRIKNHLQ